MLLRSWRLFLACWQVLRSQPELTIFPLIAGAASLVLIVLFAGPLWITGYFDQMVINRSASGWSLYLLLFLLGFCLSVVTNFCTAALTAATLIKLAGRDVTLEEAFDIAWSRLPAIIGFSLIGATVGTILRYAQERTGLVGAIAFRIVGFAWQVTTFMVVPVLVVEGVGPIEGIKRSGSLLKQTWGERAALRVGLGAVTGMCALVLVLASLLVFAFFSALGSMTVGVVGLVLMLVVGCPTLIIVTNTLRGIYTAALYGYATGRGVMPGFQEEIITGAFRSK